LSAPALLRHVGARRPAGASRAAGFPRRGGLRRAAATGKLARTERIARSAAAPADRKLAPQMPLDLDENTSAASLPARRLRPFRRAPPRGRERRGGVSRTRSLRRARGQGELTRTGARAPQRRRQRIGGSCLRCRLASCIGPSAPAHSLRYSGVRRPRASAGRGFASRGGSGAPRPRASWHGRSACSAAAPADRRPLVRARCLRHIGVRRPAGASGAAGFSRDAVAPARRGHGRCGRPSAMSASGTAIQRSPTVGVKDHLRLAMHDPR